MLGPDVTQRLIAVLIVVGLGVGVWLLWPRDDSESPTTTSPLGAASTTTDPPPPTPTTSEPAETTTLTGVEDGHVVETVEEAEAILRELWFGWFEGIYNQDEDRIRQVVASQDQLHSALEQFGSMEFADQPTLDALHFEDTEILRSDARCLAVWSRASATFRPGVSSGVNVMRWVGSEWLLVGYWALRGDLWEDQCDALLEPLS
jgi:hypothetical protein